MPIGSDGPGAALDRGEWTLAVAPAKLNLGLDVVAQREDGFHDIRTVFQAVDFTDELRARPREDAEIVLRVEGDARAPGDRTNLVVQALRALSARRAPGRGADLRLLKRIPVGGGLGGGSSDAAAALVLGERIWGLDPDPEELRTLAVGVGSDVPFFLMGGTALGEGRGEVLTRLAPPPAWGWVLAISDFVVETADVFGSADKALTPLPHRLSLLQQALQVGDFMGFSGSLGNDLEPAALAIEPGLMGIRDWLRARAPVVGLSGSGSTLFAVTPSPQQALRLLMERDVPGADWPPGLRDLVACAPVPWGVRIVGDPAS